MAIAVLVCLPSALRNMSSDTSMREYCPNQVQRKTRPSICHVNKTNRTPVAGLTRNISLLLRKLQPLR
jgi:hypothetical protein